MDVDNSTGNDGRPNVIGTAFANSFVQLDLVGVIKQRKLDTVKRDPANGISLDPITFDGNVRCWRLGCHWITAATTAAGNSKIAVARKINNRFGGSSWQR